MGGNLDYVKLFQRKQEAKLLRDQRDALVKKLFDSGLERKEIAWKLGLGRETVCQALRRMGVKSKWMRKTDWVQWAKEKKNVG